MCGPVGVFEFRVQEVRVQKSRVLKFGVPRIPLGGPVLRLGVAG